MEWFRESLSEGKGMDLMMPRGPQPHDGFLVILKKHSGPLGKQSPMCRKSTLGFASCHWSVAYVGKRHKRKETDVHWWSVFLERSHCLSTSGPHLHYENFKSSRQNSEFRCGFLWGPVPDVPHPLLSWAQNSVGIYTSQFLMVGWGCRLFWGEGVAGKGLWDGFFSLILRSSPGENLLLFWFYNHLAWWRVSVATRFLHQDDINSCLPGLKRKIGHSIPTREYIYRIRE